jgi:hypothetical protein
MVRTGSSVERRVKLRLPRSVKVIAETRSRIGTLIRAAAMPSVMPSSPPPQVLYRGCSARSRTMVRAPADAAATAAERPPGPAPTMATSQSVPAIMSGF